VFGTRLEKASRRANLDIFFLDMVGGASTLIVTPLGESVLIDTGSLEPKYRDVDRIYRATQYAGLKQIDHLITTHFHSDHFGGIQQLSELIPIKKFYDKGALAPAEDKDQTEKLYPLYKQATKGQVAPIKAGDDIPLKNDPEGRIPVLKLHCVAAEKKVEGFDGDIDAPAPGYDIRKPDNGDNARSIALVLTYGKFKFFAGGDITWNVEHHLAHPRNIIGKVDLYQVTHHGLDLSNNPILLKAINPTVCVAMNGPRKGIQPNAFRALKEISDLQAIYQTHYNTQYGKEGNTQPEFIANMKDPKMGEWIQVSVNLNKRNFAVRIGVNGSKRTYPIK
jgi:beta-lactamase superfamily II metal-dependent hydrolase